MTRENYDRIRPLRWGWIAVACEIDGGCWIRGPEAAELSGLDTATLRRLVAHGLVTAIQWEPRQHYSYLEAEMVAVGRLTAGVERHEKTAVLGRLLRDALSV